MAEGIQENRVNWMKVGRDIIWLSASMNHCASQYSTLNMNYDYIPKFPNHNQVLLLHARGAVHMPENLNYAKMEWTWKLIIIGCMYYDCAPEVWSFQETVTRQKYTRHKYEFWFVTRVNASPSFPVFIRLPHLRLIIIGQLKCP